MTSPAHESLQPGQHCRISESEWFDVLETAEPLHQWGSALLVAEEPSVQAGGGTGATLVRAYWRDDSEARRHTAWRFDAATSRRIREQLELIERASAEVADVLARAETRRRTTLDELRSEDEASARYTQLAEGFYRELLRLGPSPG